MRTSFELAKLYNHVKRCQNGNTNTVRAHGAALPCTDSYCSTCSCSKPSRASVGCAGTAAAEPRVAKSHGVERGVARRARAEARNRDSIEGAEAGAHRRTDHES